MANTVDIAGLLTGISSNPAFLTQQQQQAAVPRGAGVFGGVSQALERSDIQNRNMMRAGVGGLMSGLSGISSAAKGTGFKGGQSYEYLTPEQQNNRDLSNIDFNNADSLEKLPDLLDRAGMGGQAMALRQKLVQQKAVKIKEQKQREALITQAKKLGLDSTVDLLENNGDMKEAADQIREVEKTDLLSRQGRRAKTALATKANVGEAVIAQISNGAFDSLTPAQFIDNVLKGEKATLKAFTDSNGKPVMRRVNDSGKIYDAETETWKNPSELQVSPAVAVNKNINVDGSKATGLAYTQFTESFELAQDVAETWEANAQAQDLLDKAYTGLGSEIKLNLARLAVELGLGGTSSAERVEATQSFIINRAKKTIALLASGALGAGVGISDNDRKFAASLSGSDTSLSKETIQRLLTLERTALRNAAKRSNKKLDLYLTISGEETSVYEGFRVPIPSQTLPVGVTVTKVED